MCGLITIKRLDGKDVGAHVMSRYEQQKHRGKQGFGFVAVKGGSMIGYERAETEEGIKDKLIAVQTDEVMFHHRYPTSTPNFEEAAHPIKVSHETLKYDYYVTHNGVIWDTYDWKTRHNTEGYKYNTEMVGGYWVNGKLRGEHLRWNDSESLAIELALDLEANGGGVQVSGSIAFVAMAVDKTTGKAVKLYWGRNSESPLKFNLVKDYFFSICSEGSGDDCKVNTLYMYDYATADFTDKKYQVGAEDDRDYERAYDRDYEREYEISEKVITNTAAEEARVIPYNDMPEEYYVLLENQRELTEERKINEAANVETVEIEAELSMIEDRLMELEEDHDLSAINRQD